MTLFRRRKELRCLRCGLTESEADAAWEERREPCASGAAHLFMDRSMLAAVQPRYLDYVLTGRDTETEG